MMPFAAQIACLTASGAASGAAARPSTICATVPGTVGWAVAPGAGPVAGGVAGGSPQAPPPGPEAAHAAGAALKPSTNSTHINIRDLPRTTPLFRRPAGLADGLARKEPAPPVDDHGISPKQPGSPVPRTVRGFGVASKVSDVCGSSRTKYREVGIVHPSRRRSDFPGNGDVRARSGGRAQQHLDPADGLGGVARRPEGALPDAGPADYDWKRQVEGVRARPLRRAALRHAVHPLRPALRRAARACSRSWRAATGRITSRANAWQWRWNSSWSSERRKSMTEE